MVIDSAKKHRYIPALDGLRGVAILLVMGFHGRIPAMDGGFIGVDIFFVLSGFLITKLLLEEFEATQKVNLRNFYIRRILRLLPALLLLLISWNVIVSLFISDESRTLGQSAIALFYMSNWARAFRFDMGALGHTWSLSIEEQFYIFWPLFFLSLMRWRLSKTEGIMVVMTLAAVSWLLRVYLVSVGTAPDRMYNGTDCRADSLLLGCALAMVLSSVQLREKHLVSFVNRYGRFAVMGVIVFLGWVVLNVTLVDPQLFYWVMSAVALGSCVVITELCLASQSWLRTILEAKWLTWVGSISYGLYLWHFPIYLTLQRHQWPASVTLLVGTLLTFAGALFSRYVVELPLLKLKTRFSAVTAHPDLGSALII